MKSYIRRAIKAKFSTLRYLLENRDSFYYKDGLEAYNKLKTKGVRALMEYDLRLYRKIEDYSFADSFYQFFYWDRELPSIVFFIEEEDGRNKGFASTYPKDPYSKQLNPISGGSFSPEWDFFLNWEDRDQSFLTMGYNGAWFIVKDNCMYYLKGNKMEKASDYFRANADKYTFEGLTNLFLGFHEGLYPVPK